MKIKSSELRTVCGPTSKLPAEELPEIAFAGRSNVGKSSLINSLLNRKNLARTSSSPGKTVTINFYIINEMFYLVDLPGYGYAKASLQERAKWGKMIEKYLSTRDVLRAVVLLVDIRHAPTKDDVMMYEWIVANGLKPIIVATKLDKIKRSQKDKNLKIVRETLGAEKDVKIVPYSSETKAGRDELLMILNELLV
ncbi:MAG: ribosome biogenesis GTP-binding protein YihA/YsxC [Eubacterium sp.]|jgi:GTP-binding protein|nr:ribosome biogenesis GTP-binding protein YihA/YsxC [Eubacterium sp.]